MIATDDNLFTEKGRKLFQERTRGRDLGDGTYRQFCVGCGLPMAVSLGLRYHPAVRCPECELPDDMEADPLDSQRLGV